MKRIIITLAAMFLCLGAAPAFAQNATTPSPRHFQVVFENSQVRVLHVYINAKDKTEPHELHDAVAVPLTDYDVKFTGADGKVTEAHRVAGQASWVPGGARVVEAGDKPAEAIVVELKTKK
ncbi:MAG TPA: hypothetical protein VMU16_07995 [Candidatus Binataceae bacterium]|nr:hypothetical protein [Candidatus Binataceae bacterium]